MSGRIPSFSHKVCDFRQILFLPLIRPESPAPRDLRNEPDWRRREAKALSQAKSVDGKPCWVEIKDHMRHLTPDGADVDRWAYQEFVYFHEFIQSVLFDDGEGWTKQDSPPPLRMFKRIDVTAMQVTIPVDKKLFGISQMVVPLLVERLNLYLFSQGVAILCIEVAADPDWTPHELPPTLAHVQALQNALRRLYPPYFKPAVAGGFEAPEFPTRIIMTGAKGMVIADEVMKPEDFLEPFVKSCRHTSSERKTSSRFNPVAKPWKELLRPLQVATTGMDADNAWRQVVDERMPTMTFMSCPTAGQITDGDWLRLVYLDTPGYGFAYDRGFEPNWEATYAYDRHWYKTGHDPQVAHVPSGTRYLISPYSFVVVGTPYAEMFPGTIGQHFRRMYADMMLLNHFQFSALLALSSWISGAVEAHGGAEERQALREKMRTLRGLFLEFVERFWFTNVSNQIQARELYGMIRDRMETRMIYDEVSKQLADANEYLETEEQAEQTDAGMKLNTLAALGIGASLTFAFFALFDATGQSFVGFNKFKHWTTTPTDLGLVAVFAAISYFTLDMLFAWLGTERARPADKRAPRASRLRGLLGDITYWCFIAGVLLLFAGYLIGNQGFAPPPAACQEICQPAPRPGAAPPVACLEACQSVK